MRWMVSLGLVACGGDGVEETTLTECEGAGDPLVELGEGGRDEFTAWQAGAGVPIEQNGETWGFYVQFTTEGLDLTRDLTTLLRYSIFPDPETTDAGASLHVDCAEEGPGWFEVFVPLPDEHQSDAVALAGTDVHLTGSVTDQAAETGSDEVDVVLEAP
jgi:hypothetical protein